MGEKPNNHNQYLQIDTQLVAKITRLLNQRETIQEDFKKSLKLVNTQLLDNARSLYHDYKMQTEHFNEFAYDIIDTI